MIVKTSKNFIVKTYFYHRGSQLISVILIAVVLFASAYMVRQFHTYSLNESNSGSLVEEQEAETSVLLPGISIGFEIH